MKVRNAQNKIVELEDANGNIVGDQENISELLVNHFKKKFEYHAVTMDEGIFDIIPKVITDEENAQIDQLPSSQEIKEAIFSMDPNSSPGPDVPGAKRTEQFRPIGLSNFCFKIITRIITTRLHEVLHKVISSQQGAFIKGRNIQEKIILASELVNELDTKRRGGNVGLKLDITQDFDSMSWDFIFKTLKHLVSLKERSQTGRPPFSILFVKAEEILSRNITRMVHEGLLKTMVNRGGCQPSHLMFADDIFIFCNGHKRTLDNLMSSLTRYQAASRQTVNRAKSKCFICGVTEDRNKVIAERLQMEISEFPDKYLGVMLSPGRFKSIHVWGMMEMLQKKLAGWIGKLLDCSARLTLMKFFLCSIPIYNMSVYKWPKAVIKECERIIRNFLWTGDPSVNKLVIVKWEEVNAPLTEGGLGIRRLEVMNKALLLKLLWKIETEDDEWTRFMRAKYKNKNDPFVQQHQHLKVSNLIVNGEWHVPDEMKKFFEINELPTIGNGKDKRIWILKGARATKENVRKIGFDTVSKCYLCGNGQDNMVHILWECSFSKEIWKWLGGMFNLNTPSKFEEVIACVKNHSSAIRQIWYISSFSVMVELWMARNLKLYDNINQNAEKFKDKILSFTKECGIRITGVMENSIYDLNIIIRFGIKGI
ncbi:uncharacterized protein LOC113315405 [Papaver somniferum]|uniref:uncharacterized protein LOC113315405 n=1 Tax=Papaver somniferum TaxID=3469 RepID=UPI000E701405|nr:uncharacterized protein LOC113315405 [Papaver somniferum]